MVRLKRKNNKEETNEDHAPPKKDGVHIALKIIVALMCIITLISFVFGFTDFGQIFNQGKNSCSIGIFNANTTNCEIDHLNNDRCPAGTSEINNICSATKINRQEMWASVSIWLLIFTISLAAVFFYFIDKFKEQHLMETTSFILTKPEKQYQKIRDWAEKNHGLELRNCIRVGRSNPPSSGEASSAPHTLHFLFEIYKSGYYRGCVWIDNSLFKNTDIFWLMKIYTFPIDSASKYWWGDLKNSLPQKITDTSMNKRLVASSQEQIEDIDVGDITL